MADDEKQYYSRQEYDLWEKALVAAMSAAITPYHAAIRADEAIEERRKRFGEGDVTFQKKENIEKYRALDNQYWCLVAKAVLKGI